MTAETPEELLRRAERLHKVGEESRSAARRRDKFTTAGRAQRHIAEVHEGLRGLFAGLLWIWENVLSPVLSHPWARAPLEAYGRAWHAFVFVKDKDGDEVISKRRAGLMILFTLMLLSAVPSLVAGTAELIWDASWMATTYRSGETWYLGRSQEVDPAGNVFSAQGCAQIACSDQTSIYFRIKPSVAHHIWSYIDNGNIFFPDFVAAGIQNDINECEVTRYGPRWKFLVRNWDIYPQILSVDCTPVTEEEIERSKAVFLP